MPIQQTAGFTDDAKVHCAHILSLGWQTHQASVETASMSIGKNVLTGPQHTLILCTSRAQILQQVLVRRAGVCQILMQPCYRPLQRFQSRKQGSGVLLNIVTMNLT